MKKILIIILSTLVLFAAKTTTQKKIETNKSSLHSSEILSKQLNKKLDDLAKDVLESENKLKNIANDITKIKDQINELQDNETETNKELNTLSEQNKELIKNQKEIEQNIIRIIAQDFSMDLMLENDGLDESYDAIMSSTILSKLNDVLKNNLKKMSKNYEETSNLIKEKSDKIAKIQNRIKEHKDKQNELISLRNEQKNTIRNLKRDKEIYTKKLQKLQIQQDELRQTLEQLAIVEKREKEAKKDTKSQTLNSSQANISNIKQLGSSYQKTSVKKYTGAKTIAPLDSFSVKQKFGNYVDPVYNIKIFNESVVLNSKTANAKVKTVLDGKVVFAKQTQLLDKVIIIQHSNGIHTIYAHLNQIAPTIKVGKNVKKGYVIGRVLDDLTFEVTQKNYHIDPLELIKS
ncbi:zinc metallopeptidase, M23 family [Campylobacter pinnipediorum subsp. caledonicus]|uniref:Zinc metallopeptidase, M23 family n=1 Tax=Campylobacter pinnipediorum subsp. caledonicus TaxID=1874362 RepID=A0A1S6U982_9BACT|nr:peptidoglycan DD-metalloendopeptidase family protein [Campylobacter pinnipediorum]AQW86584.1 zinc metallopeptidase, M23 family [Campylobacter pinnipediorum subsp. caledonicus]AQW88235.1 zinc metallopeptidase, M23 family [Campylobacter pinnipediorum subsp. caledonicus]